MLAHDAARIITSLLGGIVIAATLLWLMQQMLSGDEVVRRAEQERPVMEFVRLQRSSETRLKQREKPPEPPPEEKTPPRPPRLELDMPQPTVQTPQIDFKAPNLPLSMEGPYLGPARQGPADRDFMAITRVPPRYPYRAERKGIEGWVKVSFLITAQGSVSDVVLVESSPEGIFDHAAIKAVMKWKFKPRIVDGEPVSVRVQQVVNFRLDT